MAKDTISLTTGTTTKELKLARDSGGACLFKSYELSNTIPTGSEPIFSQTDWSGGMGAGDYRDPLRWSDGYRIDTTQPGQFCLGPIIETAAVHGGGVTTGYPYDYAYFKDYLYMLTRSGYIYKWSTTDSHWDEVATGTAGLGLCVHNGYMFVACGGAVAYRYTADGTNYTSVTGYYASGFLSAPSNTQNTHVLWRFNTPNEISAHTTGLTGADWTRVAYIGDTSADITSIFLHQNMLFVGKEDGLYHYDYDGKVYPLLTTPKNPLSTNFSAVATCKGSTYFNIGTQIGEITAGNAFDTIEPLKDAQGLNRKDVVCHTLASDGENLYAGFYNSTVANEIFKGCEVDDSNGNKRWAWTPWTIGSTSYLNYKLYVSPSLNSGHPRLWMGTTEPSSLYLKIAKNPTATTFCYSDAPSFATTGWLETSWIDLGHRDWDKIIDSVLAECRGTLAAGRTVTISYYADEGSITQIDTAYSADTAGTKKYLDTAPVAAKKIKFRIALASNNSAYTPIVKYFAGYGSVRPTRIRMFDFTVFGEQGQTGMSAGIRDFLITCRDATTLVTLVDRFGASHYVRVLPGYPVETEMVNQEGKQVGVVMHLVCEKVDWS